MGKEFTYVVNSAADTDTDTVPSYPGSIRKHSVFEKPRIESFMEKSPEMNGKNASGKEPEIDHLKPAKRASILQMYRYASFFDIVMVVVGCTVAIVTGMGFPFLSTILGDVSQGFINYESARKLHSLNSTLVDLTAARHTFEHHVVQGCLKYAYVGIAIMCSSFVQVSCFLKSCENITNRIRREFFKSILRQDISWFDERHSGTLAITLFDNMERVREGMGDKMGLMIQFVAQFFGGLIIALTYNWKLTLIMMSLAPFLIICGAFIARIMATSAAREAAKYAEAGAIAEEILTSVRTVLAFNGQEKECKKYDTALEAGMKDGIKKSFVVGFGLAATFVVMFSSFCLAFWVGTDYVYWRMADSDKVLTVFFSVMMGSMALGQAGPQFAAVGTAFGCAGSVFEVIDRVPEIDSYSSKGKKPAKVEGRIKVNNLRFSYPTRPDVPILKGVSFACNPGETVALVGSSGCGKSTIVGLLLRYYNPKSGNITVDDVPVDEYNIEFLRRTVGVVNQEPILFNTTILENIRFGNPDATDKEIEEALRKANALGFINSFPDGLNTLVGDRGAQMSGGQKQRIAIARALLRDPKILLLDEATSALDAESESVVQQALENASIGRTTIVIAHRLSTIKNANKIIAMKAGEVVETGTHDELLAKKGLYYELVNAQVFTDIDDGKKKSEETQIRRRKSRASTVGSEHADMGDEGEEKTEKEKESDLDRLKRELAEEGAVEANLFKILKYAKPETFYLIIGTINALVQGAVFPAFSICFTELMNVFAMQATDPEKMRQHGHYWALGFLVLAAVEGITMVGQCVMYGIASERLTRRLRSKVFRNVLSQDGYYFDMPSHSAGKITTRLATDAPNVRSAIDYRLGTVLNAFISMTCGLGIAFYFGWQMALLMLGMVPILGFSQAIHVKMFEGSSAKDAKEMEGSGKVAMEAIENIRTVQSLTLERRLYDKFCGFLEGPHKNSSMKAITQGATFGLANSVIFFVLAAEFRFGCWLVVSNTVPQPMDIMRVLFAIQFSATSIGFASAYFPEYMKAKFAAGLIFKMLGEKPKIDSMAKGGQKPKISGAVTFKDVKFHYPQRPDVQILKGLDIEVKPGETLALVGPSGCGKSTVISLLERFYDPIGGKVFVDGCSIQDLSPTHLRGSIALVSQEPILFDTSIKENIIYGLPSNEVSDKDVVEAAKKANIHSFISSLPLGYETRTGDKGTQLSGGQKQRIAIARALIRNPKILLLDEATSALDTESEKLVQGALDAASEGRTCIVIAHRLSTVVNANCIAVVKGGRVIEKGTHTELMSQRGAYYELTIKQQVRKNSD